jgi:hypothetical protein
MRRQWIFGIIGLLMAGCGEERGDSDLAHAITGPGVEVHCAGLQRTPSAIGDTSVDVACQGTQP